MTLKPVIGVILSLLLGAQAAMGPPPAGSSAPEAPALVAPLEGTKVSRRDPLVMNWIPVRGAASYRLEIDRANKRDFVSAFRQTTPGTSLAAPTRELGAGGYRWRVVAIHPGGIEKPSEVRRFTLF